jgi:4a-hydroxytetrahydrobiopterin dehydratase
MPKLSTVEIKTRLKELPEWSKRNKTITRTYQFKDFLAAIKFVNAVAKVAEKAWHHPDIDIRWNQVTLTLTTHDEGGLTDKDFALARQADRLAA